MSTAVTPSASAWKLGMMRCRRTGTASALTSSMSTAVRPLTTALALADATRYCEARGPAPHRTILRTNSLLWLSCGRAMMGDDVRKASGANVKIRYAAADAMGLHSVRFIADGKVIREISGKDAPRISGVLDLAVPREPLAVRLECTAADQRRAFSSPLFIRAQ